MARGGGRGAARRRLVSGGRRGGGPRGRRLPRFNFSRSASGRASERASDRQGGENESASDLVSASIFETSTKRRKARKRGKNWPLPAQVHERSYVWLRVGSLRAPSSPPHPSPSSPLAAREVCVRECVLLAAPASSRFLHCARARSVSRAATSRDSIRDCNSNEIPQKIVGKRERTPDVGPGDSGAYKWRESVFETGGKLQMAAVGPKRWSLRRLVRTSEISEP